MRGGGGHHVHKLSFIGGGHDRHVRQAAEVSDIEGASMGCPISADKARAIYGEAYGQVLDCNVVDELIIPALQEGRVDRAEWLVAFCRKARRKGDRMLFGDADVERALGESLTEKI